MTGEETGRVPEMPETENPEVMQEMSGTGQQDALQEMSGAGQLDALQEMSEAGQQDALQEMSGTGQQDAIPEMSGAGQVPSAEQEMPGAAKEQAEGKRKKPVKKPRKSPGKQNSGFLVQGAILAASGIISSLIGLMYRLPLTRIIGDEGNGYYSAAFNVYTIILLLSSYSLPLAVSKMVSARVGRKEHRNAFRIFAAALGYATLVGGIGCMIIWYGSTWFAEEFLHIPNAAMPLKALGPTVWIVSYLGVCRGYWQGHSTMVPTAFSQIIEQIVNAVVSVGAAWYFVRQAVLKSLPQSKKLAMGAMGGTIGTGSGALAALLIFLFLFILSAGSIADDIREDTTENKENFGDLTKTLVLTVIPVILSTAIYNMGSILDNAIFGQVMFRLGESSHTAADYGIYTAKYKLLINVPIMVANSVAVSLVPALSRANAANNRGQLASGISSAIRFSMIVSMPSAVGLAVMADQILPLLFGESGRAVTMMHIGAAAVVFYSLSTVSNAILQGTSHMRVPVRHAMMSLVIHVALLLVLLLVFRLGIVAVVLSDMAFAFCMCLFNALSIRRLLSYRQEYLKTYFGPLLCALLMGAATYAVKTGLMKILRFRIILCGVPILMAVAVYAVLLIRLGCISEEELVLFPKGTSLVRLAKRLHLM